MTKPQTHTAKNLHDSSGDISLQMVGTVRCLQLDLCYLVCRGCGRLLSPRSCWQRPSQCGSLVLGAGEIQTAAQNRFSVCER